MLTNITKKSLAAILALLTLTPALAACGGNADAPVSTETGSAATETTTAETTPLDALPKADYKGYEFKIFGATESTDATRGGNSDYFFVEAQTGDVIEDAVFERNSAVEDKYGVKFTFFIDGWQAATDTMKANILAGDDTYDLYTSKLLRLGSLIVSKYFVNWNDVPGIDLSSPWFVKAANDTYSLGDSTILLFGDFMETNVLRCWNMAYNKTLAASYKIPDLYGVVTEGKWTIDYLSSLSKDISRDLDGDGNFTVADMYGLCTDKLATLDAFSRSLRVSAITKDKDNMPSLSFMTDKTVTAFDKLYALYWENTGTFVHATSLKHIEDVFSQGRAVFSTFRIDYLMMNYMRDMADDYGVLPYPKLDEAQSAYYTYLSGTFSPQMIAITQPESDWERTGTVTNALNAYGWQLVTPAIYEVTLKTKTARDEESLAMFDLILSSRDYSFDACDESKFALSPLKTLRTLIGGKNKDIASYYASNEAAAKAWISDMVDQYKKA